MWKQQELRKRKWDGKERESVSEDILLSWAPPDIKNNWEPDPVGPSREVKIFPQLPSPADQRLGPPASTSHPPPAFEDNAYVSAEQVLRLLPPQQQQGSPGADRWEVPKQAQREALSASYSNWQHGLPQAQAEGTTAEKVE